MSEEEIKKIKCIHLADRRTTDKLCPAIEELKKEKEKSHTILQEYKKMLDLEVEYLEEIDRLQKENEELKELNNAGIEKIRKLEKENYEYFKQLDLDYVEKNFVSKDKIKDKIKELEKECETELLTTWLEAKIDVLEELLKENKI